MDSSDCVWQAGDRREDDSANHCISYMKMVT
jgi:hypothetical protein